MLTKIVTILYNALMSTQTKKNLLFYVIVRFIYLISTNTLFSINLFQYFMLFSFCKFCTYDGNLTQHFILFDCIRKELLFYAVEAQVQ